MGEVMEVMAVVVEEVAEGTEVVTLMVAILLVVAAAEVIRTAVIQEVVEVVADTKHSFLRIPVSTLLKHESPLKCFSVLVNLCSTDQLTF